MAIAITVQEYLSKNGIEYDTLSHPPTQSSMETAQSSQVESDRVAKGVLLRTEDAYLLAVLPASHHIRLAELRTWLNESLGLASEDEIAELFNDCEPGAIPVVGTAYGLDVVIDDNLVMQPDVYFEGGDHTTLVHVTADNFRKVLGDSPHTEFRVQG